MLKFGQMPNGNRILPKARAYLPNGAIDLRTGLIFPALVRHPKKRQLPRLIGRVQIKQTNTDCTNGLSPIVILRQKHQAVIGNHPTRRKTEIQ